MTNTKILAPQSQKIRPELFDDFVHWIDRPKATTRSYIINLRQFAAWLAYSGTNSPQRDDIILYRQWLQSEHDAIAWDGDGAARWKYRVDKSGNKIRLVCSVYTVRSYLQSVKQFFAWTASEGLYPNIAEGVRGPKIRQDAHKRDALTAAELLSVEQNIMQSGAASVSLAGQAKKDKSGRVQRAEEQSKRLMAMYLLAVNAGLRTIELSRANVSDFVVRGNQSWLYIYGKGHAEADEKKALAPEVAAAISDYLASRSDAYTGNSPLFVATGNRSGGKRIAQTTISTMIKKALIDAGYDDTRITAHSCRHSCGTGVMSVTHDLYATQRYMRHANPATTEIYLHDDIDKSDADTAEKFYRYYHDSGKSLDVSHE